VKQETSKVLDKTDLRGAISILFQALNNAEKKADELLDKVMDGAEDEAFLSLEFEKLRNALGDITLISVRMQDKKRDFVSKIETYEDELNASTSGL